MKKFESFRNVLGFGLIFVGAALWLALAWLRTGSDSVPYHRFKQEVMEGGVLEVVFRDTQNLTVMPVRGEPYGTTIPYADEQLLPLLEEYGVEYGASGNSFLAEAAPLAVLVIIMFLLGRMVTKAKLWLRGYGETGEDADEIVRQARPGNTRLSDVAGYDEIKGEVRDIISYLNDPSGFGRLGARPPRGILLEGPPGTGKTHLARAVAGEAGVPFLATTGSSFSSRWAGTGSVRMRQVFRQARSHKRCILFIDEIDAVGQHRSDEGGSASQDNANTLNALLTEMDGFEEKDGIVVIGTTNRTEAIDRALLRPGRFDRRLRLELPDRPTREAILRAHMAATTCDASVDTAHLAALTVGLAGAHLEHLVNEAATLATRKGQNAVSQADFLQALERATMGIAEIRVLSAEERRRIAVHEGGHALVAAALGIPGLQKITILNRGAYGGYNMSAPDEAAIRTRTDFFRETCVLLGGRAAERGMLGSVSTGSSNDLERVETTVRWMLTRFGISESVQDRVLNEGLDYPETVWERIESETQTFVGQCFQVAENIVNRNRKLLDNLVAALLENDTLEGEALADLLRSVPLDLPIG